jgi:predicted DNA-binding transcriptional regulator AlpA
MSRRRPVCPFPNAVKLKGPDGVERLYVPVPEDGVHSEVLRDFDVEEHLRRRVNPVTPTELARWMGRTRFYIYKCINQGQFPDGSILRSRHSITIRANAALAFYLSHKKDPME